MSGEGKLLRLDGMLVDGSCDNQRIIVSEIFIYSPDKMKRNLVRQMEASLYTLKLPGSKQEGAEIPVGVTSKDTTNNK